MQSFDLDDEMLIDMSPVKKAPSILQEEKMADVKMPEEKKTPTDSPEVNNLEDMDPYTET